MTEAEIITGNDEICKMCEFETSKVYVYKVPNTFPYEREHDTGWSEMNVQAIPFHEDWNLLIGAYNRALELMVKLNPTQKDLLKQDKNFIVNFGTKNFLDLPKDKIKNSVIYCDIPYFNTTTYKHSKFPYEQFYDWCEDMGKNNIVLISEYYMPECRFKCIWQMELKTTLGSGVNNTTDYEKVRVEKLFIYDSESTTN